MDEWELGCERVVVLAALKGDRVPDPDANVGVGDASVEKTGEEGAVSYTTDWRSDCESSRSWVSETGRQCRSERVELSDKNESLAVSLLSWPSSAVSLPLQVRLWKATLRPGGALGSKLGGEANRDGKGSGDGTADLLNRLDSRGPLVVLSGFKTVVSPSVPDQRREELRLRWVYIL